MKSLILVLATLIGLQAHATPEPYATANRILDIMARDFYVSPGSLTIRTNLGERFRMNAQNIAGHLSQEFDLNLHDLGYNIEANCFERKNDGPFGLETMPYPTRANAICIAQTILQKKAKSQNHK